MPVCSHKQNSIFFLICATSLFSYQVLASSPQARDLSPCDKTSSQKLLAHDDFTRGLEQWVVEQQDSSGKVSVENGVLDIQQPAGATLWFKKKLKGDYVIEFTATPIPLVGGKSEGRISDLNMFWNGSDPRSNSHNPTILGLDGALASYNFLQLYYVGFGANDNTTSRLRRYDGGEQRPQITGYATSESLTSDDRAGAIKDHTRLHANEPVRVRIISRKPTAEIPENLFWYANEQLIFSFADAQPYLAGWFGFRTTLSHFQIRDFRVHHCKPMSK